MSKFNNRCLSSPKQLAVILASLGVLTALPASATVTDGLSAAASAQAGGNLPVTAGPDTSTPSANVSVSDSDAGSYTNASSWGHVNGPYRASANGVGAFDSTGHFIRSWNILNDSGVAQHYAFNFFIYYGSMSADAGAGGNGHASYAVNITQDGSTDLFSSSATIFSDGSLLASGTQLDSPLQFGSSYSWGGTYVNLDLGILANGESTSIVYDLVSHAFGDYDISTNCNGGYGYGEVAFAALAIDDGYGGGECTGSSYSSLGDPDSLNSTPIPGVGFVTTPAVVPEPATLALLGLGLAGFGLRRRRQHG